jgi:endonuclease/exonuclease/phosphatase (EEP) superfamily protein YafD
MRTTLYVLSVIMVLITLLPLVKSDKWFFRVFDYPRLQKFFISALLLSFMVYCCNYDDTINLVFIVITGLNLLYLTVIILPYTIFGKKQVLRIDKDIPENSISLLISNVYQDNTNYKGCRQEIKKADPDMVLLLEADQKWEKNILLDEGYPYSVKVPLNNTYGMLLYSKLELRGPQVKYLVEDDVPSIHTKVVLKNGQEVQLYAVHPTPPVPNEKPQGNRT